MAAIGAGIASFFAADAGAAVVGAGLAAETAAATEFALIGAGATAAEAGVAAGALGGSIAGTAAAAGAGAIAGGSILGTIGTGVATSVGSQLIGSALAPNPKSMAPSLIPPGSTSASPLTMPDPLAQEAARKKSIVQSMTRRGRASTVLTNSGGSGTLGG